MIQDYELIVTSHYQKYIEPDNRKAIKSVIHPGSGTTSSKVEVFVDNVNLTRLSAQHIVDLVERLIN